MIPSRPISTGKKTSKGERLDVPMAGKTVFKISGGAALQIIPTLDDASLSSNREPIRAAIARSRFSRRQLKTASLLYPASSTPMPKAAIPRSLTKAMFGSSESETEPPSRDEGDHPAARIFHTPENEYSLPQDAMIPSSA
uniref:Uncharacterized protein n=1 Tax=Peronospora matthiolae TaxID=2874970 RepID=A0AAV1TCS5_9STRA